MSVFPRSVPDAIAHLISGDLPRALLANGSLYQNAAFEKHVHRGRDRLTALARDTAKGAAPPYFDEAGYRYTTIQTNEGTLICGVPIEDHRDSRMRALPELFHFTNGLAPNVANLHRLMQRLHDADPQLFTSSILFGSRSGNAFVTLHDIGSDPRESRSWLRWPLERLFVTRRAGRIVNPLSGKRALALPFPVPPSERYLVVAVLKDEHLTAADEEFLKAVECVASAVPLANAARSWAVLDRVDLTALQTPLRCLHYGGNGLEQRLAKLAAPWGWTFESSVSLPSAIQDQWKQYDFIVVDGSAMRHPEQSLRALRHVLPETWVLYVGKATGETIALTDEIISPNATDFELLRALKRIARDLPMRHRDVLRRGIDRETGTVFAAGSYAELCGVIAKTACETGADWCAVHIVDDAGTLHHAECPSGNETVFPELPASFMNGYALIKTRIDEYFLREVTSDEDRLQRLRELEPVSGAALPIAHQGHLVGSILALSTALPFEEVQFEALARLSALACDAYARLRARIADRRAGGLWTRVTLGSFEAYVFSPAQRGAYRQSAYAGDFNIEVEIRGPGDAFLNGSLSAHTGVLDLQSSHMPPPIVAGARTAPAALRAVHDNERIVLPRPGIALLFPPPLGAAVERAQIPSMLADAVKDDRIEVMEDLSGALGAAGEGFIVLLAR